MPQCPFCGSDLPGVQTLCQKCYDARYAQIARPRSFLESMRQFVSNPLCLTEEDLLEESRVSFLVVVAFWCSGLLICWFGGWARVHYKYSLFSNEVLSGALLCIGISIFMSLVLARTNLRLHWKIASPVFVAISMGVAGHFFIGSNGVHKLIEAVKW
jgi:hypothetical protein